MANEIVQRGIVARALAAVGFQGDAQQSGAAGLRFGRYGESYALSLVPSKHLLADEGSYFTVNNGQAGIATAAAPTAFSATNPFLLIYNRDTAPNGRRIYLDFALLLATAAGTAGTSVQCAVTSDAGNRFVSGGSALTPAIVNGNQDAGATSVAQIFAGNITAAARTISGNRLLKGAIPVAGDQYVLNFGGVDAPHFLASATVTFSVNNLVPLIIGPNQSALIHLWLPAQTAAASFAPELGWWER
jgi:hypothetical protein